MAQKKLRIVYAFKFSTKLVSTLNPFSIKASSRVDSTYMHMFKEDGHLWLPSKLLPGRNPRFARPKQHEELSIVIGFLREMAIINYIGVTFGFAMVVLLQCTAAQTVHVVGDSMGWTVPQGGAQAYINWANGKNFMVGDILTFDFATNNHDVLRVPKASFDGCTASNPIGETITTGPANITLDSAGEHYYICTVGRHCLGGQKLAITVSSGTTRASPPSTTPRSAPPTSPTASPSPSSNSTPADCAPTPASSPISPVTPESSVIYEVKAGFAKAVEVSSPHSEAVFANSFPPSECVFREDGILDEKTNLHYDNTCMFDAQLDAGYAALEKTGFSKMEIIVSETGWASDGNEDEAGATLENAKTYNHNMHNRLAKKTEIPYRPKAVPRAYIFALFNENLKPGPTSER
ncbi:unnamed protein product [Dovyalis caffra]|uniref:glucan endo-1,3-beta-D-glucosidase n=1 Tax=Dovyalis caffra TaxID=77055 RepID=A0AAV1SUM9_9ROSI|nr:unnamed protein product [Dovyalis caffra]